jgi:hypothetical protein
VKRIGSHAAISAERFALQSRTIHPVS